MVWPFSSSAVSWAMRSTPAARPELYRSESRIAAQRNGPCWLIIYLERRGSAPCRPCRPCRLSHPSPPRSGPRSRRSDPPRAARLPYTRQSTTPPPHAGCLSPRSMPGRLSSQGAARLASMPAGRVAGRDARRRAPTPASRPRTARRWLWRRSPPRPPPPTRPRRPDQPGR